MECFIDNQGSVIIFSKGYSTKDALSNTLVKAINEVSTALNCTLFMTKIARCSNPETICADALSKKNLKQFQEVADSITYKYGIEKIPEISAISIAPTSTNNACSISSGRSIPETIIDWLSNPTPDRLLGHNILLEMSHKGIDLLGYN